jgi:hypothetical protein
MLHGRVLAQPHRIAFHLALQVAGVETRKPGCPRTVPTAVLAMAGEAGKARPGVTAAERDQLAAADEMVG